MGLQPASGHFQRFMEDALQRHGLLYTTEDGKRRNPDTGKLEGFVAVRFQRGGAQFLVKQPSLGA